MADAPRPPIHQFHQGIRRRDAVGELMLHLRDRLRERGHRSEILVDEEPPADLRSEVGLLDRHRGDPDALLVAHHSIGHRAGSRLLALPDRLVLWYHNVTPSAQVSDPSMRRMLERGRQQLALFRDRVVGGVAASAYNARELEVAGYPDVVVVPPITRLHRPAPGSDLTIPASSKDEPLVLFVGRISRSKRQVDVVDAFDRFADRWAPKARLAFVGAGDVGDLYLRRLHARVARSPFARQIDILGSVSDDVRARLYGEARLYLSMSEHEGFGVPLLESFSAGVPVLAYDAAAVAETMGGAGVLFARKDLDEVAAMMAELVFDEDLRHRVIAAQRERLDRDDLRGADARLFQALDRWSATPRPGCRPRRTAPRRIQIQGPFETSYSLAVTNRRLAEALSTFSAHDVSISCMEGGGPYSPSERNLADKPLARALWQRSFLGYRPDVVIRNTYPPRFERVPCRLQLAKFYWEETELPDGWADGFNRSFDGILVPSTWVGDVLRASGVTVPVAVLPSIVDLPPAAGALPEEVMTCRKKTKFLSVSSGFPRKGVDALLRAFFAAFRAGDDVVLVVKTFPNIHNDVATQLATLRAGRPDAPEVIHVDRDLPDADLAALLRSSDALVQPSRAEGFGLPAAEAMLLGIPVIATSVAGLADFCRAETCFVIPHRMAPSRSHLATPDSLWAEPDEAALASLLREFAEGALQDEAKRRGETAVGVVKSLFSPEAVAARAEHLFEEFERRIPPASIGFVSTWNTRCGIAATTEGLIRALAPSDLDIRVLSDVNVQPVRPDGPEVSRVWDREAGDYEMIVVETLERGLDAVHLEFHPGLFCHYEELSRTISELAARGIRVFVTVHLVSDVFFRKQWRRFSSLGPALRKCERVITHAEEDVQRLAELGVAAELVPLGGISFPRRERAEVARALGLDGRRVVGSFGFALPHKGFLETIEASEILRAAFPDLLTLLLASRRPEPESDTYLERCRRRIEERGLEESVLLIDRFLSEEEVGLLLSAAEVVVLPYGPTLETASGAVRFPLSAGRATMTTGERIFHDAGDAVLRIEDNQPKTIAHGLKTLLSDDALRSEFEDRAVRFAEERSWKKSAERHLAIYRRASRRVANAATASQTPQSA